MSDSQIESLECPRCASKMSRVLETRDIHVRGYFFKLRVRQCGHCRNQFRSKEIIDTEIKLPSKSRSKKKIEEESPPVSLPEKQDVPEDPGNKGGNPFF